MSDFVGIIIIEERSDVPYGYASKLLFGEVSEATEPYNKYEPLRKNQVSSISAVTALG